MHRCLTLIAVMVALSQTPAVGAPGRILKVLPMYLDKDGLHTRSPSLYDRDAYQAYLRRSPSRQSGMLYAVELNTGKQTGTKRVRLELRGVAKGNFPREVVVETFIEARTSSHRWVYFTLRESEREYLREVTAWRVTLWDPSSWQDETLLAEQTSFLW